MIEFRHLPAADASLLSQLEKCWLRVLTNPVAGFTQIPHREADWDQLQQRLEACRNVNRVLVLGIGGSSLGTQVVYDCFRATSAAQVFFLESIDPYKWTELRNLGPEWRDSHVVIVSKSGTTLETLSWVERLFAQEAPWITSSNCTVVASSGEGPLQKWAKKESMETLWIPENVGGRFSVLTAAGMFPAGLMGLDLYEFRKGALWALDEVAQVSQVSAAILKAWERNEWITQMWTYSEGLRVFGQWWQQLWSESLGKRLDRQNQAASRVSTPMFCLGPRDQHSLLQQLLEGHPDKNVFLTRVRSVEKSDESFQARVFPELPFHNKEISLGKVLGCEASAFEQSLVDKGVVFHTVELEHMNERSLGALFMFWQMVIAQLGEYLNIDAFNQPGVELGKRHTEKLLRQ